MPIETEALRRFVDVCHYVQAAGLVAGSGGNLSMKFGDRFLITPSGRALASLRADDLVLLNEDGTYRGTAAPSKEYRMHLGCYLQRSDIAAVLHVHSAHAAAISCLKDLDFSSAMPAYTPGYALRIGDLPTIPYHRPGCAALARETANLLKRRDSALLANHGAVVVGRSLDEAVNYAEEIEENARLHFILEGRGRALDIAARNELAPNS